MFEVEKDSKMQVEVHRFFLGVRVAYSLRAAATGIHLVKEVTGS